MGDKLKVACCMHEYSPCEPAVRRAYTLAMVRGQKQQDIELFDADCPSDGLIERLRSGLVTQAIIQGADILVWLDNDIAFQPDDLLDLARRCSWQKSVVGCMYPFRAEVMRGQGFPVRGLPGPDGKAEQLPVTPGRDQLIEVQYVSGGFTAFWVPQLQQMVERLEHHTDPDLRTPKCCGGGDSFFWSVCRPVNKPYEPPRTDGLLNHLSDDWVLQWRLREAVGAKVWLWTRPLLRHIGKKDYGIADALAMPVTNEKAEASIRERAVLESDEEKLRRALAAALGSEKMRGPAAGIVRDALRTIEAIEKQHMAPTPAPQAPPAGPGNGTEVKEVPNRTPKWDVVERWRGEP